MISTTAPVAPFVIHPSAAGRPPTTDELAPARRAVICPVCIGTGRRPMHGVDSGTASSVACPACKGTCVLWSP